MPRRLTVRVEADVPLHAGTTYRVVVFHIEKKTKPQRLEVELRNMHALHQGRPHIAVLPLPLHTYGKTAEFFRAVGEQFEAGHDIDVLKAVGKTLLATFGESSFAGQEVISFSKIKEPSNATESQ